MQITAVNFNIKTNTPSFGAKVVYRDIKQIRGIHCACCGNEVLQSDSLEKAYKKISKPLSLLFEKGFFDFFKKEYAELYEYLKSIATLYPKKNLDQIVSKEPDILRRCSQLIYKGLDLSKLDKKEARKQGLGGTQTYYQIRRSGRALLNNSAETMSAMAPYKKYLHGEKLKTFEQLEIYADKYPDKTLSEIINMPEIYDFHNAMDMLHRAELCEKREFHFNRILKLIQKENPNAVEEFEELKGQAIELIASTMDAEARIPKVKKLYEQMLEQYGCNNIKPQVLSELEKLPTTFITKDSFLAYAKRHKYNDIAILESLFTPVTSSEEHIIPISKNGTDYIGNRLVLCRDCNQKRDNIPYSEFIEYHPQMPHNTQQQADEIAKTILAGQLMDRWSLWPLQVAERLSKASEGLINLDITEFAEKFEQKSKRQIVRAGNKMEKLEKEKADLEALLIEKENKYQQVTDKYNEAVETHRKFSKLRKKRF